MMLRKVSIEEIKWIPNLTTETKMNGRLKTFIKKITLLENVVQDMERSLKLDSNTIHKRKTLINLNALK